LSRLYAGAMVSETLFASASPILLAAGLNAAATSVFIGLQKYRVQAAVAVAQAISSLIAASAAVMAHLSLTEYMVTWVVLQLMIGVGALALAGLQCVLPSLLRPPAWVRVSDSDALLHM